MDRVAIDHLQRSYADGVTRRDWDAVRDLFLPDATISLDLVDRPGRELAGPDELVGFVASAIERFDLFEFVILNARVELWPGGDRSAATCTLFLCELRAEGDPPVRTEAYGRYLDTYRKADGRWRIAGRRYRSMARLPDGAVFRLDADG